MSNKILIVDDDESIGECVNILLTKIGYKVHVTTTGNDALKELNKTGYDLLISDLKLPDIDGLEVLRNAKKIEPSLPVIIMTSYSSTDSAIEALRHGAIDYIIKPFDNDELTISVNRALNERRLIRENTTLKRNLASKITNNQIIGNSEAILELLKKLRKVATSDASVLILGESGTGKELIAQEIHSVSNRSEGPFVPLNCGAIPTEILESELFGHKKGAFTGASNETEGLIRSSNEGTLFLDEISELELNLQVKLLRVIQDKNVRPLGSNTLYHVNTRFVAATNKDLRNMSEEGLFREDLFFRLNVISLNVPPLRERTSDIELLANHFIKKYNNHVGKKIKPVDKHTLKYLRSYEWPGNVRELENCIERGVILAESNYLSLSDMMDSGHRITRSENNSDEPLTIDDYAKDIVCKYQNTHTETEIAKMLGIARKSLWERRKKWGLTRSH